MKRFLPASLALALSLSPAARAQNAALSGDVQFDGARPRPAAAAVAAGAPGAFSAAPQDADLLNRLVAQVSTRPDDDPRAAPALREAFAAILRTRTGRELAQSFVDEGAVASVGFETIDGSGVAEENGIKVVRGTGGYTRTDVDPPLVTLNRAYLDADPEYRRVELASVLAHEMLGHALESQRAPGAGVSGDVLNYYRGDEGNASLIGWLVRAELGGRLINWSMWKYLEEPERFYKTIRFIAPDYALSLSPAEMRDPASAWRERLDRVPDERASLNEADRDMRRWQAVIRHLVADHGIDETRFSNISADISYTLATDLPDNRKTLDQIERDLSALVRSASTPKGRSLIADIQAAVGSAYVSGMEDRLDGRVDRLRSEVGNRRPETAAPPDPNQITWPELQKMWREDDPAHKRTVP